jgi:hypothetical protein
MKSMWDSAHEIKDRVAALPPDASGAPWLEHPAFGKMSDRAWGVQIFRHMDHHLEQFGA